MTAECDKLVEKITELEFDRNEHKLVQETLEPLEAGRKAYRLVGGVLVERTVGEVLPSVKTNKENVSAWFSIQFIFVRTLQHGAEMIEVDGLNHKLG